MCHLLIHSVTNTQRIYLCSWECVCIYVCVYVVHVLYIISDNQWSRRTLMVRQSVTYTTTFQLRSMWYGDEEEQWARQRTKSCTATHTHTRVRTHTHTQANTCSDRHTHTYLEQLVWSVMQCWAWDTKSTKTQAHKKQQLTDWESDTQSYAHIHTPDVTTRPKDNCYNQHQIPQA